MATGTSETHSFIHVLLLCSYYLIVQMLTFSEVSPKVLHIHTYIYYLFIYIYIYFIY